MSMDLISILIVTYNCRKDVENCLASIYKNPPTTPYEILLLDNGSSDDTRKMVETHYPYVQMTGWSENRGLAIALKFLITKAKGDWLLFLDSDTIIPPGSFDNLLKFSVGKERLGAVAPRILDISGNIQMTARNFPRAINSVFGRQTILSRIWPGNPITRKFLKQKDQNINVPFLCDWVAFAAVLVRKKAIIDVESIDDQFFVYWVDADLFRRFGNAGWEVWCDPSSEISHIEQNNPNRIRSPLAIKDFNSGALRYFYKHHGWGGLNPLLWFAAVALWSRTRLQLITNRIRRFRVR